MTIDDRTKVNLFGVAIALPVFTAVIVWAVGVASDAATAKLLAEKSDLEIRRNKDEFLHYIIEIDKRTVRIEEYLKTKRSSE